MWICESIDVKVEELYSPSAVMSWLLGLASLATLLPSVLSYNYCRVTPYHTLCGYNGG